MAEETTDFPEMLRQIREKDPRFTAEAYAFTFQGLDYTMHEIKGKRQHVTGQDLLEGIRRLAAKEFGRLAPMVFKAWGVTKSSHFGDIVYNLIEAGVMSRRDEDKREDFDGGWDLATAFDKEEESGAAKE
ncbi:MAG: Minf_1886 family protein [Planctomycetota bacterium]